MAHWKKEIEPADEDSKQMEVHRFELKLLLLNVSKEEGDKLWAITIMNTVDYSPVCKGAFEEDLTKALVIAMTMAVELLEVDGKTLVTAMGETIETIQKDEIVSH